jgi:hypothetical protein
MFIRSSSKYLLCGLFFLAFFSGCSHRGESGIQSSALKQALAGIDGRFSWRSEANVHAYSKWQELTDAALAQSPGAQRENPPESVLAELVECLSDSSLSASVFGDRPIPLGWVCYAALTGLIYHEETDKEGDIVQHWDGYPKFPASPQDMEAAKVAWRKVLAEKAYLSP